MRAQALRDWLAMQAATTVADAQGGRATTWGTVDHLWGRVDPLSGRERLQASALQSDIAARITVRYRSDLTVTHRLVQQPTGPTFEITALRDPDGRRAWLEVDVLEVS